MGDLYVNLKKMILRANFTEMYRKGCKDTK